MTDLVAALNIGSSSIKLAVHAADALGADTPAAPVFSMHESVSGAALEPAVEAALRRVRAEPPAGRIVAVGHRIVHGGRDFAAPTELTDDVLAALETLVPLAPQHQPANLAGAQAAAAVFPDALQVGCFDTAFHRTQPRVAEMFALPAGYAEQGVIRYGFHGLSYAHAAEALPRLAGARPHGKAVVAHLGSGASMCAMRDGRSIATTMGFTALDGLAMARRSGAIDPGLVLYLLEQRGMSAAEVRELLYERSGLLGLSGISDDMRVLLASEAPAARLAVEHYVYRAGREIGSLAAALGGLDALVFTGGVGENSAPVRAMICAASSWLGVRLDDDANAAGAPEISAADSAVGVHVLPANEEWVIARQALSLAR